MKCGKAQELFSSYLEKTIQPPLGVAFEQHLAECARCKAAYDRFHATTIVLDELPMVQPPPDLHAIVMQRVKQAHQKAPLRVKWLHLDWQSALTLRLSAKTFAAGLALMLVFVMAMQVTPINSYMAGIFGVQRTAKHLPMEQNYVTPPEPAGFTTHSGEKYANIGTGLSVSITAEKTDQADTLYDIRMAADKDKSIQVRVYELPEGVVGKNLSSDDLTSVRYIGSVSCNKEATARIIQPKSSDKAKVAMLIWKNGNVSESKLVYIPPQLGMANGAAVYCMDENVCDILSNISAAYGTVLIAPTECGTMTASINSTSMSATQSLALVTRHAGLKLCAVGPSIYLIK